MRGEEGNRLSMGDLSCIAGDTAFFVVVDINIKGERPCKGYLLSHTAESGSYQTFLTIVTGESS